MESGQSLRDCNECHSSHLSSYFLCICVGDQVLCYIDLQCHMVLLCHCTWSLSHLSRISKRCSITFCDGNALEYDCASFIRGQASCLGPNDASQQKLGWPQAWSKTQKQCHCYRANFIIFWWKCTRWANKRILFQFYAFIWWLPSPWYYWPWNVWRCPQGKASVALLLHCLSHLLLASSLFIPLNALIKLQVGWAWGGAQIVNRQDSSSQFDAWSLYFKALETIARYPCAYPGLLWCEPKWGWLLAGYIIHPRRQPSGLEALSLTLKRVVCINFDEWITLIGYICPYSHPWEECPSWGYQSE